MRSLTAFLLGAVLLALLGASYWLARHRIYQVDECNYVYTARILATGQGPNAAAGATLYMAPLAWLARDADSSVDLFGSARLLALTLFWANVLLLARATGERMWSSRGLLAVFGAATLAPLWDYGFEVRHDNLLLCGILLLWLVLRVFPKGVQSYACAGALAVVIEFVAFKGFVYTLPISAWAIAVPDPRHATARVRLALAWLAGALGALLLVRLGYGEAGWWEVYVRDLFGLSSAAAHTERFGPWFALSRHATQSPLVTALALLGVATAVADAWRRRVSAPAGDSLLPEVLLLLLAGAALLINPTPFPYNLVHVVPFAFLVAWRYGSGLLGQLASQKGFVAIAATVLVASHVVPFGAASWRHFMFTNARQTELMRLAEHLTAPLGDPVYDGIGLVPTRPSVNYRWLLHSLNLNDFLTTPGAAVRDMLAARPAAVLIPSYRTDWLSPEDHQFIRARYVPLADDFWVLGGQLPPGGGRFDVVHPGRYWIVTSAGRDNGGLIAEPSRAEWLRLDTEARQPAVLLDGQTMPGKAVTLTVGTHRLECPSPCVPGIVWVGPRLNSLPRLEDRDHRLLFVNWY